MKRICLLLAFLIVGVFIAETAMAQTRNQRRRMRSKSRKVTNFSGHRIAFGSKKRYWSVGAQFVLNDYFGDIAPRSGLASTDMTYTKPGVGILAMKRYTQIFSLRAEAIYTRLQGSDVASTKDNLDDFSAAGRYVRNLSFRNDIFELSVSGVFDFFGNAGSYQSRRNVVPYAFIGAGLLFHNPKALVPEPYTNVAGEVVPVPEDFVGEWVSLQDIPTDERKLNRILEGKPGYSKLQFVIPAGLGVRFRLTRQLDFALEVGYRQTFFDYLDDSSEGWVDLGYPEYSLIASADEVQLARVLSDRSQEPFAVVADEPRDFNASPNVQQITQNLQTYESNGQVFTIFSGYGRSGNEARGSDKDFDVYVLTTFKLTYILGTGFGNPKFR
jgi:hypothetical protein